MKKLIAVTSAFAFAFSFAAHAQSLSSEDIKAQMIKEWERAKSYTVDYLNAMPTDKYSFKAVDSIRSFAQQMLHLAQGNLFIMSNAYDQAPPGFLKSDLEHSATAQNKDSVMYYVTASYDYCINAVKNIDVNKWGEKKKMFGMEVTRYALMIKTFEHQTHHRGQTTIYIRLLGIRPPQERLFM
jgi:uncharacterized damage-inducible protein DinB